MERFPQDLPLRELCTAEASFHPELRKVSPKQVLRALVELVDRAGGCLARFLGRLTETNLIKAGPVYVNHGAREASRSRIPSAPFAGGSFGKWSKRPLANWGKRPIPPERFFCLFYAA